MKYILLITTFLCFAHSAISQKTKVKFKKGIILVDGVEFCKYEKIGGSNYSYKLDGEEFLYVKHTSVPTGKYHSNGHEIKDIYVVLHFTTTELGSFESDLHIKVIIKQLISNKVVENGKFNPEQAALFQKKFAEDVSSKYSKKIEININN